MLLRHTVLALLLLSIATAAWAQVVATGTATMVDSTMMNNKEHVTNAIDAIRGRVAGLQVERNGANALNAVRLRGTSSLSGGNNPLIIVDGVMGDLTLLQSIYPTDIESFEILKDASETSQYGSRGAAGVIKVTTMKGSSGRMKVNYNGLFGVSSVYKTLDMLSAGGYRNYASSLGLSLVDLGCNTDFNREITRDALTMQHHLAFHGGSELSNYRVSLGYIDEQSIIKGRGNSSFLANMNASQTMFDGLLHIDLGMFGSTARNKGVDDVQKLIYSAATFNPTYPNHKNSSGSYDGYSSASQINNPLALLDKKDDTESSHLNFHARLLFHLIDGLDLSLFGAYSYDRDEQQQYFPTSVWNKGQAYRATSKKSMLMGNMQLTFQRTFGIHGLNAAAMVEFQKDTYSGFHTTVTNFSTDINGYNDLSAGALRPWNGTGSYYENPKMASFMGRVGYSLMERYALTASVRADGSSKFGENHKWGVFPSVSASWILSREKFMESLAFIDNLKLNVGYGVAGNQDGIDSYTTLSRAKAGGVVATGNDYVVSFSQLRNVNPDLKWEVSKTFNIGFDAQFFDGRLIASLNFYHTKVSDMLYPYTVSVPPFTYPTLVANLGSMRNRGLELSLGGTPISTRDVSLSVNVNMTFQSNKLLSLGGYYEGQYLTAPTYHAIGGLNGAGFHGGYNNVTYQIEGYSLGTFYLPKCTGLVADEDGRMTYSVANLNGGELDLGEGEDRYIAGQAMPKMLLGSNISLRYKDFDISVQMNGAFGHKIFNGTSLAYMNMGALPLYNVLAKAPKQNIYDQTVTDYWLESGNYLNIDYITIGWRVPLKKNRIVEGLRLSLTMNNVATITSYSGLTPMINSANVSSTYGIDDKRSYPLYHTYTFGVSVNF